MNDTVRVEDLRRLANSVVKNYVFDQRLREDRASECVLRGLEILRGKECAPRNYVARAMQRRILDLVREERRRISNPCSLSQPFHVGEHASESMFLGDALPGPDVIGRCEDRIIGEAALARLGPEARMAVVGAVVGFDQSEMAATLGVQAGTFRSRTHRQRKALEVTA